MIKDGDKYISKTGTVVTIANIYEKCVRGKHKGRLGISYFVRPGHLMLELESEFLKTHSKVTWPICKYCPLLLRWLYK